MALLVAMRVTQLHYNLDAPVNQLIHEALCKLR